MSTSTTEVERIGTNVKSMAKSLGWKEDDQEGPFEFWSRKVREIALEDATDEIETLIARIKNISFAARGGNALNDNAALMRFIADRLVNVHHENENIDYIRSLRERAALLENYGLCRKPIKEESE